jgi:hypothetical protein
MATLMRKAAVAPAKATRTTVKASASLQRVAQAAGVAVAGFSLALSANAASVKLGADSGKCADHTPQVDSQMGAHWGPRDSDRLMGVQLGQCRLALYACSQGSSVDPYALFSFLAGLDIAAMTYATYAIIHFVQRLAGCATGGNRSSSNTAGP